MAEQLQLSQKDILLGRFEGLIKAQYDAFFNPGSSFYNPILHYANTRGFEDTRKRLIGLGYTTERLQEMEDQIRAIAKPA